MKWSFPSEFEHAVRIERKFSSYGFFAFIATAYWTAGPAEKAQLVCWWPDLPERIEQVWTRQQVADIVEFARYARPITFVICAALHADLENQRRIEQICPGLNEELAIRFNTAGSLLPGERRTMDGKLYECIEVEVYRGKEVQVKRKVVEVSA